MSDAAEVLLTIYESVGHVAKVGAEQGKHRCWETACIERA